EAVPGGEVRERRLAVRGCSRPEGGCLPVLPATLSVGDGQASESPWIAGERPWASVCCLPTGRVFGRTYVSTGGKPRWRKAGEARSPFVCFTYSDYFSGPIQ